MTIKEKARIAFEKELLVSIKCGTLEFGGRVDSYDCFGLKVRGCTGVSGPKIFYRDISDLRFLDETEEEEIAQCGVYRCSNYNECFYRLDLTCELYEPMKEEDLVESVDISKQRWEFDPESCSINQVVGGVSRVLCKADWTGGTYQQMVVMAAAPEMLDVLEDICEKYLDVKARYSDNDLIHFSFNKDLYLAMIEVIKKARGG